jgi:MobA/MobL family
MRGHGALPLDTPAPGISLPGTHEQKRGPCTPIVCGRQLMAIFSLSADVFSRSKGHHATAAAAYRAGELIRDETIGERFDYSSKRGIRHSEIIAPDEAPGWMRVRSALWNAVEAQERRSDSQLAREIMVALPHELDESDQLELVRGYIRAEFVSRGMVADFSIHEPSRDGDERNVHCHIMLTLRQAGGDGFASKKSREWNSPDLLEHWREAWAQHANEILADAGFDESHFIDHRSLEAQGSDRIPGIHQGKHATAEERKGRRTDRGDRQRDIERENEELDQLVDELAQVDAEISEREKRRLDERYGPPGEEPAPDRELEQPLAVSEPATDLEQAERYAAFEEHLRPATEAAEQTGTTSGGSPGWWENVRAALAHYRDSFIDAVRDIREAWRSWRDRDDDRDMSR